MDDKTRESEIMTHYLRLWGQPSRKFSCSHPSDKAPSPLFVYEFAGNSRDNTFVYATIGASRKAVVFPAKGEARMELFILSNEQHDELVDNLSAIAVYPFVLQTYFGEGHTIHGSGQGIVAGSPLSDILLTRADYGDTPDYVTHSDESHTHLFWVVPIFQSEREFAVKNGWRKLQELFDQKHMDVLDFQRSAAI